jgi:hypothetical protein
VIDSDVGPGSLARAPRACEAQGKANVGGYLASLAVVIPTLLVMARWSAGATGDALLGAAAVGLLFRTPHPVAIWAGLTLLAITALALIAQDETLANSLGNFVYYALVVGCLWAGWNLAADRYRWRMPCTDLHHALLRRRVYRYVPAPLAALALAVVAVSVVLSLLGGPAVDLLAAVAVLAFALRLRHTVALWAVAALAVVAALQSLTGRAALAWDTAALAAETLVVAGLLLGWQALLAAYGWSERERAAARSRLGALGAALPGGRQAKRSIADG